MHCANGEKARIWEDNLDMLTADQVDKYGCLNMDCCDELESFISSRISVITVANIVIAVFLVYMIINSTYMEKVVDKYPGASNQNHSGDSISGFIILGLALSFVLLKSNIVFTNPNGPPLASFAS